MQKTTDFYEGILGFPLVKTLEGSGPNGKHQHFFFQVTENDGVAFFWFPDAPEGVPGESLQNRGGVTAIGSMNHVAFDVPAEHFDAYRQKLLDKGVRVTEIINHANSLDGGHRPDYDPDTDDGDVFIRSMYFKDPNGTTLEFACWTKALDESDVRHAPATRTTVDAGARGSATNDGSTRARGLRPLAAPG